MVSVSVRYLFYILANKLKDQDMASSFSRQYGEGIVRLASRVAVWRQSEVSVDFCNVLGRDVFSPERSHNQKPRAFVSVLYPFVCCFCFVPAFLFQGHTKTALINSFCPPSYCLPLLLVKRSTQLPGTALYPNVSLAIKICAKEGGKKKNGLRLPSLAFSWSLALCHQSLAFRARLLNAKPCKKRGA